MELDVCVKSSCQVIWFDAGELAELPASTDPAQIPADAALPDSVHLEEDEILLGCGDAIALNARIPAGQGTAFRWESSDANVACVDESGNVRAIAPGSAEIRVHTLNGLTDSCIITILEAPTAISLHPDQVVRSLSEGAFRLELSFGSDSEGGRYSISSSDPAVAQAFCQITATRAGSAPQRARSVPSVSSEPSQYGQ